MPVFCNDCGAKNIEGSTCCEECGTSLSFHNKFKEPNSETHKTISSNSNVVDQLLSNGEIFFNEEKYKEAIECYDKVLKLDSNNVLIWHKKGGSLEKLRNYQGAINCYDKVLELDSNDAFAWSKKGNILLYQLDKYEEAIKCYDRALELDNNNILAWHNKGISFYMLSKYEEAISCYDKALELNSNYAFLFHKKGLIFQKLHKYEEAINCYDKALLLDSDDTSIWNNKGLTLVELGKYEEAINCYDKALELAPYDAFIWHNKGSSFYKLDNYKEAVNCYDKALELDRYDASLWNDKGDVLQKLSRYEESIICYDKALELEPHDAFVWHKRNILQEYNSHPGCEVNLTSTLSYRYIHITSKDKPIYLLVDVIPFAQSLSGYLPVNLACVIDESMYEQEKFEYFKKAIIYVVEKLRSDDLLSIVFCSKNPRVLPFNQKTVDKENFINMLQLIDTVNIPQGSNMYKGITIACDKVMKNYSTYRKNHIILFTADLLSEENKCLMKCVEEARKWISLSTMGIGNNFNQKLLMDIADITGGKSYYIDVLSDIPNIFAQELKGLQSIVAQNLILHLKLSRNIRVKRAYKVKPLISDIGDPKIINRVCSVKLNDLQKDEPQSILYELILPSIQVGSFRIAQTILDYDVIMKGEKGKQVTQDIVIDYTSDYSLTGMVDSYVMNLVDLVGVFCSKTKVLELAQIREQSNPTQLLKTAETNLMN